MGRETSSYGFEDSLSPSLSPSVSLSLSLPPPSLSLARSSPGLTGTQSLMIEDIQMVDSLE